MGTEATEWLGFPPGWASWGMPLACLLFFFLNIYLFICLAVSGLICGMRDLCWVMQTLQLWHKRSVVEVHGLSCSVACGILVPHPEVKPISPALQGGFLTTAPPGTSLCQLSSGILEASAVQLNWVPSVSWAKPQKWVAVCLAQQGLI